MAGIAIPVLTAIDIASLRDATRVNDSNRPR